MRNHTEALKSIQKFPSKQRRKYIKSNTNVPKPQKNTFSGSYLKSNHSLHSFDAKDTQDKYFDIKMRERVSTKKLYFIYLINYSFLNVVISIYLWYLSFMFSIIVGKDIPCGETDHGTSYLILKMNKSKLILSKSKINFNSDEMVVNRRKRRDEARKKFIK